MVKCEDTLLVKPIYKKKEEDIIAVKKSLFSVSWNNEENKRKISQSDNHLHFNYIFNYWSDICITKTWKYDLTVQF